MRDKLVILDLLNFENAHGGDVFKGILNNDPAGADEFPHDLSQVSRGAYGRTDRPIEKARLSFAVAL